MNRSKFTMWTGTTEWCQPALVRLSPSLTASW